MENSLLQAFIAGHQVGQSRKQQRIQKEQHDQEIWLREQQQEEHAKEFEKNFELQKKLYDLQAKHAETQDQLQQFQTKNAVGDAIRKGLIKPTKYSDTEIAKTASDPNYSPNPDQVEAAGKTWDLGQFGSYEEVSKRAGESALNAQKPLLDYKFGQQKDLLTEKGKQQASLAGMKNEQAKILADKNNASREKAAQLHADAALEGARIRAAATRYAATVKANKKENVDSEAISADAMRAAMGEIDVTPTTRNAGAIRSVLTATGMRLLKAKDADALKNLQHFNGVLEDMDAFIKKHENEGGLATVGTSLASRIPFTDTKADIEQLKGRAANVATFMGEVGRKTEGDINRALQVMTSPNQTTEQRKEARRKLIRDFANHAKSIMNGMPEKQKVLLMNRYDVPDEIREQILGENHLPKEARPREAKAGETRLTTGEIVDSTGTVVGKWKN